MPKSFFIILVSIITMGLPHIKAQGLNSDIGIQNDFHQYVQEIQVVDDLTYLFTREFSNQWNPKTKWYVLDSFGNILSEELLISDNPLDGIFINKVLPSANGGVYVATEINTDCHFDDRVSFAISELLPNGSIAWEYRWNADTMMFNNIVFGFSLTAEEELIFLKSFQNENMIINMDLTGNITDSIFVTIDSLSQFERYNGLLISSRANTLLAINETGIIDTLQTFAENIDEFLMHDNRIYVLSNDRIVQLSSSFEIISEYFFTNYFGLNNLKLFNNQLTISAFNQQQNLVVLTIDIEEGTITSEIDFPINDDNLIYSDYHESQMVAAQNFQLTYFTSIRIRNFSLTNTSSVEPNHSDIGVIGFEINANEVESLENFEGVYEIKMSTSAWVKNFGNEEVTDFLLVFQDGYSPFCGWLVKLIAVDNVSLFPGDSILIDMGQIIRDINNYDFEIAKDVCIYTAFPNKQTDLNVSNDSYCERVIFGYVNMEENSFSKVLVYPNPSNDFVTISSEMGQTFQFVIIDALGRVKQEGRVANNQSISVDHLSPGVYLLKASAPNGDRSFTQRIVVNQ